MTLLDELHAEQRQHLRRMVALDALAGEHAMFPSAQLWVGVWSSSAKGTAPTGYLVARVEVAPTVFIEGELNPSTNGRFRGFGLYVGDPNRSAQSAALVAEMLLEGDVAACFNTVRDWFNRGPHPPAVP